MLNHLLNLIVATSAPVADNLPAHEHGRAELRIAAVAGTVDIEWQLPMIDALGFEHAIASDADRTALQTGLERQQQWLRALAWNGTDCTLVEIKGTLGAGDEHADHDHDHEHDHEHEHADVWVRARWQCDAVETIEGLRASPWSSAPTLERITVQWLFPESQGEAQWQPPQDQLSWME